MSPKPPEANIKIGKRPSLEIVPIVYLSYYEKIATVSVYVLANQERSELTSKDNTNIFMVGRCPNERHYHLSMSGRVMLIEKMFALFSSSLPLRLS